MIRVILSGAAGKMGKETLKAIGASQDIEVVGAIARQHVGDDAGVLAGLGALDLPIVATADAASLFAEKRPDVLVDFTNAEACMHLAPIALAHGARVVTGSTGFAPGEIDRLRALTEKADLATLVAPNFAIGALLMIQFAQKAAQYFDHAEIIELHHNQKLDAPSGTAIKTAEAMKQSQSAFGRTNVKEVEKLPGARGAEDGGIRIHSVRLPGLLAHQEVLFGGLGQVLTIRHDAMSRESYMPGVLLGIRKVMHIQGLIYGLEHVL